MSTIYRCFLPNFRPIGFVVSEEKIKMWKVNGRRTSGNGKSSHCLWRGELKRCTRLVTASDQVYQLLAHVQWFSPGTPASTIKTGRHDIAETLLKVALNTINQINHKKLIQSNRHEYNEQCITNLITPSKSYMNNHKTIEILYTVGHWK